MYAVFFKKIKKSLLEENLKYLIKVKYFKSTSHFGFQLVSDKTLFEITFFFILTRSKFLNQRENRQDIIF